MLAWSWSGEFPNRLTSGDGFASLCLSDVVGGLADRRRLCVVGVCLGTEVGVARRSISGVKVSPRARLNGIPPERSIPSGVPPFLGEDACAPRNEVQLHKQCIPIRPTNDMARGEMLRRRIYAINANIRVGMIVTPRSSTPARSMRVCRWTVSCVACEGGAKSHLYGELASVKESMSLFRALDVLGTQERLKERTLHHCCGLSRGGTPIHSAYSSAWYS